MKKESCPAVVWQGYDDPNIPVHMRINLSHKKIVRWAKEEGLEMVCIAEDDIKWCDKRAWQHFLDNIPKDFDIYLGGISQAMTPPDENNQLTDWAGMHLYIVHSRFYDTFLAQNVDIDIDRSMARKGKFVLCLPMAAIQYNGISYHIGGPINYDHYFAKFPQYKSVDIVS